MIVKPRYRTLTLSAGQSTQGQEPRRTLLNLERAGGLTTTTTAAEAASSSEFPSQHEAAPDEFNA